MFVFCFLKNTLSQKSENDKRGPKQMYKTCCRSPELDIALDREHSELVRELDIYHRPFAQEKR